MNSFLRPLVRLSKVAWRAAFSLTEYAWLRLKLGRRLSYAERAAWLHRCCAKALPQIGVQLESRGTPPSAGLVISNHLTYMDILLLSCLAPCCFLSKAEVRRWPVFGWIAALGGTIFLNRRSHAALVGANNGLHARVGQGALVAVFPEGTTSDGSTVLPFHASLFQVAVESDVPLTPAYITYSLRDGSLAEDVCFWRDMTLMPHLWKLLSKPKLQAFVSFGATERGFSNRKEAAERMYQRVTALAADQEIALQEAVREHREHATTVHASL